ncbi:MAG: hypothetical protein GX660_20920 [Clostridiaceae bacterium]|nr:hypothetical protein [Clostridiaceae bacterium]
MRYVIRQKIFSIRDRFFINDEMENDLYIVNSQLSSFGKKLRIFDLQDNELCRIEQQLLRIMPEYCINISGGLVAKVKKKFSFLRNDFNIISNNGEYSVSGDFLSYEFDIRKNNYMIGHVSKKFFSIADTYGVEIDEKEDQLFVIALAIVIDMVCHNGKNS